MAPARTRLLLCLLLLCIASLQTAAGALTGDFFEQIIEEVDFRIDHRTLRAPLPDYLEKAILYQRNTSPDEVKSFLEKKLAKLEAMHLELQPRNEELLRQIPPGPAREIMKNKNLALFEWLLKETGCPDTDILNLLINGVPISGPVPPCCWFSNIQQDKLPALKRGRFEDHIPPLPLRPPHYVDADDLAFLQKKLTQEIEKGFMTPLTYQQVLAAGARPVPGFVVRALGKKPRAVYNDLHRNRWSRLQQKLILHGLPMIIDIITFLICPSASIPNLLKFPLLQSTKAVWAQMQATLGGLSASIPDRFAEFLKSIFV